MTGLQAIEPACYKGNYAWHLQHSITFIGAVDQRWRGHLVTRPRPLVLAHHRYRRRERTSASIRNRMLWRMGKNGSRLSRRTERRDEERPGKGKQKKRGNISFVIMACLTLSTLQKDDGHCADADSMSETCLAPALGLGSFQIDLILDPSVHPSYV